jgi:DNA-binding LacI/PurR family transcriptional regulator
MADVAAVAEVSRGTVSRALNGGHNVSASAMAAIRRAIAQTGYVVNQHARSLVTQRSQSVVLIVSEPHGLLFEDPNFNVLFGGCTQALAAYDFTLVLAVASSADERKRVSRFVTGGHVDGALLLSARSGNSIMDELRAKGMPVVLCGAPLGRDGGIAYVTTDDQGGARQMVRYLRDQGRRRIAIIAGPRDTPGGVLRLAGYREVLGDVVEDRMVLTSEAYTRAAGEVAADRLLESAPDLDAIFVASDLMAAGALAALRRAGRRVPDDVAVGGFDDSAIATTVEPQLTTIRQPVLQASRELVRLLLDLINGQPPVAVILPTELVVRASA